MLLLLTLSKEMLGEKAFHKKTILFNFGNLSTIACPQLQFATNLIMAFFFREFFLATFSHFKKKIKKNQY